jgi:hypothetical protein
LSSHSLTKLSCMTIVFTCRPPGLRASWPFSRSHPGPGCSVMSYFHVCREFVHLIQSHPTLFPTCPSTYSRTSLRDKGDLLGRARPEDAGLPCQMLDLTEGRQALSGSGTTKCGLWVAHCVERPELPTTGLAQWRAR